MKRSPQHYSIPKTAVYSASLHPKVCAFAYHAFHSVLHLKLRCLLQNMPIFLFFFPLIGPEMRTGNDPLAWRTHIHST